VLMSTHSAVITRMRRGFVGLRHRKTQSRLSRYTQIVAREWNTTVANDDRGQNRIKTPNGSLDLIIRQEERFLSFSSCLCHCRSHEQSVLVMKKALELNYLTRNRNGFTLAIEPADLSLQFFVSMDLTLYYSKSFIGMRLDQFRQEIKDFVEVASNVQSQLKTTNDDQTGIFPQPSIFCVHGNGSLRRPEVMPPMMSATLPQRKPSPPPSPVQARPTRSSSLKDTIGAGRMSLGGLSLADILPLTKPRANMKPMQPMRSNSISNIFAKSISKQSLMKHFDSPAEAKLFETYQKKKALYIKQHDQESKTGKSNSCNDNAFCGKFDQDCFASLKHESSFSDDSVLSNLYPSSEWESETPVISNRKGRESSDTVQSGRRATF
jgi:hypothetical protein